MTKAEKIELLNNAKNDIKNGTFDFNKYNTTIVKELGGKKVINKLVEENIIANKQKANETVLRDNVIYLKATNTPIFNGCRVERVSSNIYTNEVLGHKMFVVINNRRAYIRTNYKNI